MIPLVSKDMNINKFVDVSLPSKRQIFARVGGFSFGEMYSGDNVIRPGMKPTEQADALVSAAENYEPPKQEEPKSDDDGSAD